MIEGLIWGLALGACLGSYLTVVTGRWGQGSGLGGRSVCPACGRAIPGRWNVPVLGWLLLRGRARCCGAPIPRIYPALEAACALALGLVGWLTTPLGAILAFVGAILVATTAFQACLVRWRAQNRPSDPGSP
jgi:leader peptidase (prepilin peptidase)/N-methyltransferase